MHWALHRLSPNVPEDLPLWFRLLRCALWGGYAWLLFRFVARDFPGLFPEPGGHESDFADYCALIACSVGPFFVIPLMVVHRLPYFPGHVPPISLWGRIRTGRLIIPGYDRVFLPPMLALVIGVGLPGGVAYAGSQILSGDSAFGFSKDMVLHWYPHLVPLLVMLAFVIETCMPPGRRAWELCGAYRAASSDDSRIYLHPGS